MAKPIDNPQHISVLIPTRARPGYLQNLFDSLEENTQDKNLIDVWLYVDDDDAVTREYMDTLHDASHSFKINWVIGERTKSTGQMFNVLWQQCTTNAGIYFYITDDLSFKTKKWDCVVREGFNRYPDRILLAYPDEATAVRSDQVIIASLSAEWINITGRVLTPYFPFWFDDSWTDQVSQMIQRKVRLDIQIDPQEGRGKTTRMRNLRFWDRFFHNTLDERIAEADLLRKAIYREGSPEYLNSVQEGERLAKLFKAAGENIDDEVLIYTERTFAGDSARSKPSAMYLCAETDAVNHLFKKAKVSFDQRRFEDALAMLDNIRYASSKFQNLESARALCLKALGRHDDARRAELAELAINPDASFAEQDWREDLQLVPVGENPTAFHPRLGMMSELRMRLMPVTLRFDLIYRMVLSRPIGQWLPAFREFWTRYRRRHLSYQKKRLGDTE